MHWRDHLAAQLRAMQPASLCTLDEGARQFAANVLPDVPTRPLEPLPQPPCALALGIDALHGLDAGQAGRLIHRVQTYAAPRLLLVAATGCALDEAAFRALGFTLALADHTADVRIHHYDLATYKTVPDWLNARFWAHPERWEP